MDARVRSRLAGMMALLYAVQGSWWPLLAVHLHDLGVSGRGVGWIFATLALACIAAPVGIGHLADRLVPTQVLLSLIYAVGAGILAFLATGPTSQPQRLFAIFLVYWVVTGPSYALANSLGFRNLPNPAAQFGRVRLWGTVGWMSVGWVVTGLMAWPGARRGLGAYEAFWTAAVLSGLFALYCLRLPHTPPMASGPRLGTTLREGLELVRRPSVAVFLASAFVVSLSTPFVYQTVPAYLQALGMPRPWIASCMSLGQVLEIGSLALLPWLFRRFGQRWVLAIGVGGWMIYYGILASHPPLVLALAALPLNGVGIACFIVAGQMFLDSQAPPHRRASAQGLHAMITSGLGSLLGNLLAGEVVARNGGVAAPVFLIPCAINAAVLLLLLRAFPEKEAEVVGRLAEAATRGPTSPARLVLHAPGDRAS
jgi:MFS family permease